MDEQSQTPEPVPQILDSAYLEGPFAECVSCGSDLADPDVIYQIHKTWKSGEVVFEFALCANCAMDTMQDFSEESMERMEAYYGDHFRPRQGLSTCDFCGKEKAPDSEFTLGAGCRGGYLLRPVIVICGECTAASQDNLSRKTRDAWGEFIDRTIPGVPHALEPENVPFTF